MTGHKLFLHVHYPARNLPGKSLSVRGEGLGLRWDTSTPLKQNEANADVWQTSLEIHDEYDIDSILQLKVIVNEENTWQLGGNVRIKVPAKTSDADVYPFFYHRSGSVDYIHDVYSPQLDNHRTVAVYTPPSYHENYLKKIRYLLVAHDGQNLFSAESSASGISWRCNSWIDDLVVRGEMEEIILVGVYNSPYRFDETTHSFMHSWHGGSGGKSDRYLDFVQHIVLPMIGGRYRVGTDQPSVGIMGSSLAGLQAAYAGWTRPHVFGRAACLSSSFWWNNGDYNDHILKSSPAPQSTIFYIDTGDEGPFEDDVQRQYQVRDHMLHLGLREGQTLFFYHDQGAPHHESAWANRFWSPMKALYPPVLTETREAS
eukprot:TRINITY_DN30962_c0_g1_i1.p1 TRINITY_DN30962_c0_g1~~TRINITY_DN30962_c0_g1_i1.p1  ORF type:complete len:371 (-),score=126.36 TRINITY_DN30962_c0_g1_i1:147-1259(-)